MSARAALSFALAVAVHAPLASALGRSPAVAVRATPPPATSIALVEWTPPPPSSPSSPSPSSPPPSPHTSTSAQTSTRQARLESTLSTRRSAPERVASTRVDVGEATAAYRVEGADRALPASSWSPPSSSPSSSSPSSPSSSSRASCTAAVALRDRVPAEQQLGTQAFTVPLLLGGYDKHTYVTASDDDDGRARVTAALRAAKRDGCSVDLYLLALGQDFVSWIEAMPVDERPSLRLVYDTGGGSASYGPRWIAAGAEVFVGHPGDNIAPIFYAFFLPKLVEGIDVDTAVRQANAATRSVLYSLPIPDRDTLWANTEARVFRP